MKSLKFGAGKVWPRRSGLRLCSVPLCLLLWLTLLWPQILTAAQGSDLAAIWQRARDAGRYHFSADITQTTDPPASIYNIGRAGKTTRMYLEGETNLPSRLLHFTLWTQGGSVLDPTSGLEIKIEDSRAYARHGAQPWEEINNFADVFAPQGDFMAYLAAAQDVERVSGSADQRIGGSADRRIGGSADQRIGESAVEKYTFRIDGASYAAYLRDELERMYVEKGELPPGVSLDIPTQYKAMTGDGELWVDAAGLPTRQILHLTFPPDADGQAIQATVTVDFTFENQAAGITNHELRITNSATSFQLPASGFQHHVSRFTFLASCLLLCALFILHHRSKTLYAAVALTVTLSMLLTPLMQATRVGAFSASQAARARAQDARAEESDMQQTLQTLITTTDHNPHQAPLDQTALSDSQLSASDVQLSTFDFRLSTTAEDSGDPDDPACDQDDPADTDGDGLTNGAECVLGANDEEADTDLDNVSDYDEVTGFSYNGKLWYGDPLEMDSNKDGIGDGTEWEMDSNDDGIPDDTDGDGAPDLFDRDNDGDGVPDDLDISPFYAGDTVFTPDAPFGLVLDNLAAGEPTFVEFQLRPTNPDHLWYALNVLDWPDDDRQGQVQDADGKTFSDVDEDRPLNPDDNGDVKVIPMLEIKITGEPDNLPPVEQCENDDGELVDCYPDLEPYGITARALNDAGDEKVAYVPLTLITERQGDARVAFGGRMLYHPSSPPSGGAGGGWGNAHQVRLVWVIQALVDKCDKYKNGQCTHYEKMNEVQVIQTYGDDWVLTGLDVREDRGVDYALVYEDPAVDGDLNDDSTLTYLTYGLEKTFLAGSDCEQYDDAGTPDDPEDDTCEAGDGQRDITVDEIARRFDHATNGSVPEEERWKIANTLTVVSLSYETLDEAIMTIAMTESKQILDDHFSPYWTDADPISPTLLFAREEYYRSLNLDEDHTGSDVVSWSSDGRYLTLDFDPAQVAEQVMAGANWAPYLREDGDWYAYPIEEYWDLLKFRYTEAFKDEYSDEEDPDEVRGGAVVVGQVHYLTLYQGVNAVVEIGDDVVTQEDYQTYDKPLFATLTKASATAVLFIVNQVVMASFYRSADFLRALNALMRQQKFYNAHELAGATWRAIKTQVRQWMSTAHGIKKMGVATMGVILLLTVIVILAVFMIKGYLSENRGWTIALAAVVGAMLFLATILLPIFQITNLVKSFIAAGFSTGQAIKGVLGASSRFIGASKTVGIVGLILAVGLVWGIFIYAIGKEGVSVGDVAFSMLLAQAIGATIVAILMFALSLTIVGALIVALIALIDIVLVILKVNWTITGFMTDVISKYFFSFEIALDVDVDMGDFDMKLVHPEQGMVTNAEVQFLTSLETAVTHKNPKDPRTMLYIGYYDEDQLRRAAFKYTMTASEQALSVHANSMPNAWQDVRVDHTFLGHDMLTGWKSDDVSADTTLKTGINSARTVPLYLNAAFSLPGVECWMIPFPPFWIYSPIVICMDKNVAGSMSEDIGFELVLDVFPTTLDGFMDVTTWADGLRIYDRDGDGLLAKASNGSDPDDTAWDTDGDGLSDAWELDMQTVPADKGGYFYDPLLADTDDDGLTDGDEARLGTNPHHPDTDGDALTDYEESRTGWTFTYWQANGQDKTLRVYSDPLSPDTDNDGMDDFFERSLHTCPGCDPMENRFYPWAWNNSPIALYTGITEGDSVVHPGQTFGYTTTVQNNVKPDLWVRGDTQLTSDPVAGGPLEMTFDLPRDGGQTLYSTLTAPADAATQDVDMLTELDAQLHTPSEWVWDAPQQTARATTSGGAAQAVVMTPVDGWPSPYAAAVLEADRVYVYHATADGPTGDGLHAIGWSGDQSNAPPDLACNADGVCLVVWSSYYQTGDDHYFRWRRIVSPLATSGDVRTVTVPDGGQTFGGRIAGDGDGFLAVWLDGSDAVKRLRAQRINAAGDAVGAQLTLATGALGEADVAWAYDRYQVVWAQDGDLRVAEVMDDDITQITIAATAAIESQPRIAYDALSRRALIVYHRQDGAQSDVQGRVFVNGAAGEPTALSGATNAAQPLRLALSADPINGGWAVTWARETGGAVAYRAVGMDGSLRGDVVTLAVSDATAALDLACAAPRPAARLLFDEDAGATTFVDDAGFGNDGTCDGDACPRAGDAGKHGNAVTFDGVDDKIILEMDVSEQSYGVTFWFKTTCRECGLYSVVNDSGSSHDRHLYLKDGRLCTRLWKDETVCSTSDLYADGNWHFVAHTFGGSVGGQRLYVDGDLQASGNKAQSNFTSQTRVWLGYSKDASTDYLAGALDDLSVYPRALSEGEIRDAYRAAVVVYPFDETEGATRFTNAAHNGYTAQCEGAACPTAGVGGKAYAASDFYNDGLTVSAQPRTLDTITYNFESAVGSEWSNTATNSTPREGRGFLGRFGSQDVTLSLSALPDHDQIEIEFDLYVIGSWDGNSTESSNGPDYWEWSVDGQRRLRTTFVNFDPPYQYQFYPDQPWTPSGVRAYEHSGQSGASTLFRADDPTFTNDTVGNDRMSSIAIGDDTVAFFYKDATYTGNHYAFDGKADTGGNVPNDEITSVRVWAAANAGFTGAAERGTLGYSSDAVYHLKATLDHTGDTVQLKFQGEHLENLDNESWGLDNVVVRVQQRYVPLETGEFTVAFWANRDRRTVFKNTYAEGEEYVLTHGRSLIVGFEGPNFLCDLNGDGAGNRVHGEAEAQVWAHYACTFDGQYIRVYYNGEQDWYDLGDGYNGVGPLRIGADPFGRNQRDDPRYRGLLDELAVWDAALSADEIKALYEKVKVLDDSVTECSLPRIAQGTTDVAAYRLMLRETTTPLGNSHQEEEDVITIDADPPTANLTSLSDGQYLAVTGTLVIGGDASDNTRVTGVEVRVDSGAWDDADGAAEWSYAWDTAGLAEGAHILTSRAADAADNVGTPDALTVILDRTPPQATGDAPPARATQDEYGRWVVRLDGVVSDPPAGTQPGSGVADVEVLLEGQAGVAGAGWQPVDNLYDDNGALRWWIYYDLPIFANDQNAIPEPTGVYTYSLRATDNVNNQSPPLLQPALRLDNSAPEADLRYTGPNTMVITSTLALSGVVTDVGRFASGVQELEIAFRPAEQVDVHQDALLYLLLDDVGDPGVGRRVFVDSSGYNHHARCEGYSTCPWPGEGRVDGGASFDSSTVEGQIDVLTLDAAEHLNLGAGDGHFTLAMWIWATHPEYGYRKYGVFGHEYEDGSRTPWVQLYKQTTGNSEYRIRAGFTAEGGQNWALQSDYVGDTYRWTHMALTFDGEELRLYTDGVLRASQAVTPGAKPLDRALEFEIGQKLVDIGDPSYVVAEPFIGNLDEIILYNRALDGDDVRALYQWVSLSWDAATLATPGAITSTWTYSVPAEMEGFYGIELRGTDAANNRNAKPQTWHAWLGEIDTWDPRLIPYHSNLGDAWTGPSEYRCNFTDANLDEDTLEGCKCPADTWQRTYYHEVSVWYRKATTDTERLYHVEATCRENRPTPLVYTNRACDNYDRCTTASHSLVNAPQAPTAQPVLYSLILTPTHGAVVTTATPSVLGTAHAAAYLQSLTVSVDGAPFYTANWPPATSTDAAWNATAPALPEGRHVLVSEATDWASNVQTTTYPLTLTVDLLPPLPATLDTAVITTAHRVHQGAVVLTGVASDTVGVQRVQVNVDNTDWAAASLVPSMTTTLGDPRDWRVLWPLGDDLDGITRDVVLRTRDFGGRTTDATVPVLFDLQPPAPVTVTLAYSDALNARRALAPEQTVRDGASLLIEWTPATDGSGVLGYAVGWSESPTTTDAVFVPDGAGYATATPIVTESQALYAHLTTYDAHHNARHQVVGPIYVDTPLTPDYIAMGDHEGRPYTGWTAPGCSALGVNDRVAFRAPESASLFEDQHFYATWGTPSPSQGEGWGGGLRLAWDGANWETEGDLFVYLDTAAGGATQLYNPYEISPTTTIYLPGNQPLPDTSDWPAYEVARATQLISPLLGLKMQADTLVWVQDATTALLLRWDGGAWVTDTALTAAHYALALDHTDLFLPFDLLAIPDPAVARLSLLAVASEENALRLWAAFPERNPLNGARAVNPLAAAAQSYDFSLLFAYVWPALGAGQCPNAGVPGGRLDATLTAAPDGVAYALLGDDLAWQWDALLTAPGLKSAAFDFMDHTPPPLGQGAVITYTLRVANPTAAPAHGVQALVSAYYALSLPGSARDEAGYRETRRLTVGDLAPGAEASVTFTATVEVAANWRYARCLTADGLPAAVCGALLDGAVVEGMLFDSSSPLTPTAGVPTQPPLEWLWADHVVDNRAPLFVGIEAPQSAVAPGQTQIKGHALDLSGAPLIEVEVGRESFTQRREDAKMPGSWVTTTLTCADSTPRDGQWACPWTVSGADGVTFTLRARAADAFGHMSAWSSPARVVRVDATPPTVTLDAEAEAAVTGALFGPRQTGALWGTFADAAGGGRVDVCRSTVDGALCDEANLSLVAQAMTTTAQTYEDTPAAPIPVDGALLCGVSALTRAFTVADAFFVGDVDLGFGAALPDREAVQVTLISPAGTSVRLIAPLGLPYGFANYDVWLDDAAGDSVHSLVDDDPASPYFERAARPDAPLRIFNGEVAQGTWELRVCVTDPAVEVGAYQRARLSLTPQGAMNGVAGTWRYGLPLAPGSDGDLQTLAIHGVDSLGNRSAPPLTVTYRVDTVAPQLTVNVALPEMHGWLPQPVLQGAASDGGGLDGVTVRVDPPEGASYWDAVVWDGATWSYTPSSSPAGVVTLWVEARDRAGNARQIGPYTVRVVGAPELVKSVTPTADVPLGGVVTYTLAVHNPNTQTAASLVVTDRLPAAVQPVVAGTILLPAPNLVQWGPFDLPGGATYSTTFTATVSTDRAYNGATVTNTANFHSAALGSGVSNAAVFEIVRQVFYPIVGVEKAVIAPRPYPGAVITYTLGLTNYSDHTVSGLTLTDTLPAGVVGTPLAWSGDLPAGETRAFTLPAVITDNVALVGQTLTNTAYLVYSETLFFAEAAFVVVAAPTHVVYLPLVMRE